MRFFRWCSFVLLLTIPHILFPSELPYGMFPDGSGNVVGYETCGTSLSEYLYDYIDFILAVEEGVFDNMLSDDDMSVLSEVIVDLITIGDPESNLHGEQLSSRLSNDVPSYHVELCGLRTWTKKKWASVKKLIRKHNRAIVSAGLLLATVLSLTRKPSKQHNSSHDCPSKGTKSKRHKKKPHKPNSARQKATHEISYDENQLFWDDGLQDDAQHYENIVDSYFASTDHPNGRDTHAAHQLGSSHGYDNAEQDRNHSNGILQFTSGFLGGIGIGSAKGAVEAIPSYVQMCATIGKSAKNFAKDPIETAQNLYDDAEDLFMAAKDQPYEFILPGISQLIEDWKSLTHFEKGNRLGEILGKSVVDFVLFNKISNVLKLKKTKITKNISRDRGLANAKIIPKLSAKAYKEWWGEVMPFLNKLKTKNVKLDRAIYNSFKDQPLTRKQVEGILRHLNFEVFDIPRGLSEDMCTVSISKTRGGMVWRQVGTSINDTVEVRVMPPSAMHKKPYVVQRKGNQAITADKRLVSPKTNEAHIPLEEYHFVDWGENIKE